MKIFLNISQVLSKRLVEIFVIQKTFSWRHVNSGLKRVYKYKQSLSLIWAHFNSGLISDLVQSL